LGSHSATTSIPWGGCLASRCGRRPAGRPR
jgi:hypothetical protein